MEDSEVKQFFKDTNVFVTGATGFVGKTLVEKLLRTTDVNNIYILIREKKGKSLEERMNKMFDNALFDVLRTQKPNYRSKIKAVMGECGAEGLTISETDREELMANINIIFHSAATVNFNENLKTAYEINVKGTESAINMAKMMPNLKAFVYVSTAFANCCSSQNIEEKVYDYSFDDKIAKIEKSSKEDIKLETEKIIGTWPNSYTFTKAIAETMVKKESKYLPIGIFRPSIIVSTYKEPIPGWLDNIYGLNGIDIGVLLGVLRVALSSSTYIIDAIPVDKCVSALIVSAWEIGKKGKIEQGKEMSVYNYTSGRENPLTVRLLNFLNFTHEIPSLKMIWAPFIIITSNKVTFWILSIALQIIPGLFIDALTLITGNKPRLVSTYIKVINFSLKMEFFALREFLFDNTNVQALWKKINKTDQELFPFSMAEFSWYNFCKTHVIGMRRYFLKEDDSTIPQAIIKLKRFRTAQFVIKLLLFYTIFYAINKVISKIYYAVIA